MKLAYFYLVIGLSFCLVAGILLPKPIVNVLQEQSYDSHGFLFGTSEEMMSEESEFKIAFSDLTLDKGKANCSIVIHPALQNRSSDNSTFFLLQIPFEAENVTVDYWAWYPELYGGNFSVENYEDTTYVFVRIPKENASLGNSPRPLTFDFVVKSAYKRIDHFTYELDLTFNHNFHDSLKEINYLKNRVRFWDRLYFFDASRAFLNVERTDKYHYPQMLPSAKYIGRWKGDPSFRWDIKAISSPQTPSSVLIDIVDLAAKSSYELNYSLTWLFFGIGIPLFVSSSVEIFKEVKKKT